MYLLFLYPKLDKPILLYKHRYFSIRNLTSSIQNHTQIPYTHISIQIFIVPYLCSSFSFPSFFFSFLFFFFFFFIFLSQRPKRRYLFCSSLYFILSPFYFTFQGGNFLHISFKPHVSSTNFSTLFHSNIFLLLPFCPHFHFFILNSIYQNPTLPYKLIKL